jgi:hypothetical protein
LWLNLGAHFSSLGLECPDANVRRRNSQTVPLKRKSSLPKKGECGMAHFLPCPKPQALSVFAPKTRENGPLIELKVTLGSKSTAWATEQC